ncbi:Gfo/Idh/MocA family oxidoreductase [Streptomyces sp. SL13]|uniref:Gfo/Idh/MocA family oxidoreductase n=1 Tax=Streptantibioticus silvisoli TaxID=2705255 RepID=A0AA90KF32_9ACTN|nr:Gfo/Idh/MocA family oxidoreductase [Streptantibioticus silvisoli]MDI5963015.1 Gfo/Idh/MocA family oxidoreductase [Streptantibioticus silvisoli]MDI5968730.1 Gfo/Idh/MocA family oxidoreductase [Streptantibioticus silvisoli]
MTAPQTAPVRIGALGTSSIAWRRVLPTAVGTPGVDLVAVAGRDTAKTARFAEHFGCGATGFDALLERDDIEGVYISLPTALHHRWAAKALRAGKHVLVEKPIGVNAAEAADLAAIAEAGGLVLRENFMFLHHPQHTFVKDLAAKGRLGRVNALSADFCIPPLPAEDIRYDAAMGGGALLDVGVYPLRAARLLLGGGLRVAGATLRVRPDGLDLSGKALLVTPDGVLADVAFGFENSYTSAYTLRGDRARVSVNRAFTPPPAHPTTVVLEEQDHEEHFTLPASDQLRSSVAGFAAAIRSGAAADEQEAVWRQEAVASMELVDAVREKAVLVPVNGE